MTMFASMVGDEWGDSPGEADCTRCGMPIHSDAPPDEHDGLCDGCRAEEAQG